MTLREQLMLKRTLRQLRTWAPPISIGIIVGAGFFLVTERLERQPAAEPIRPVMSQTNYSNCDAARAAHAAPIYRGQPGYDARLDADGDGIACEPYPR